MKMRVGEIAALVNGEVEGDADLLISRFAPIEEAEEGSISFLSNLKYTPYIYTTKASAILVNKDLVLEKPIEAALIRVEDVYSTVSGLLETFGDRQIGKTGIEQPSFQSASAYIGKDVYLGAFSYVGEDAVIADNVRIFPQAYIGDNVVIGENTIIYSGVKIYADTEIGRNCILHAGSVIGSDGFGFAPQPDGSYKKVPQTGKVIIKDKVEIGANTTIDRATIKATIIGEGVKLDNLIQIAHNVEIGGNTAIAAQAGVSGSTKIGSQCVIGGQVGIVGHITIADGSQIGAQSGVARSISVQNQKWFGSPADDYKNALKASIIFKKLPELYDRIKALENSTQNKVGSKKDEH